MISLLNSAGPVSTHAPAGKSALPVMATTDQSKTGTRPGVADGSAGDGREDFENLFSSAVREQPAQDTKKADDKTQTGKVWTTQDSDASVANADDDAPLTATPQDLPMILRSMLRNLSGANGAMSTRPGSAVKTAVVKPQITVDVKIDDKEAEQPGLTKTADKPASPDIANALPLLISQTVQAPAPETLKSTDDTAASPASPIPASATDTPALLPYLKQTGRTSLAPVTSNLANSPDRQTEAFSFGLILRPADTNSKQDLTAQNVKADDQAATNSVLSSAPVETVASFLSMKTGAKVIAPQNKQDAKQANLPANPAATSPTIADLLTPAKPVVPAVMVGGKPAETGHSESHEKTTDEKLAATLPADAAPTAIHSGPVFHSAEAGLVAPTKTSVPVPQTSGTASFAPKTAEVASGPARELVVRLEGASGERISVRLAEQSGQVQIAVRSSDPATASLLRQDLSSLTSTLEHAGWKSEVVLPTVVTMAAGPAASVSASQSETAEHQNSSGSADWSLFDDQSKKRSTVSELWDEILTRQGTYS